MCFRDGMSAARKTFEDAPIHQVPQRKFHAAVQGKQPEMTFGTSRPVALPRFIERFKIEAGQVVLCGPLVHGIVEQFRQVFVAGTGSVVTILSIIEGRPAGLAQMNRLVDAVLFQEFLDRMEL